MNEGHVTIYGEIIPYQDDNAGDYGAVNLKGVMEEIKNQPNADQFTLHIHSPGGDVDEAFAIYDALKSTGKTLITHIEGLCASSATIIAMAAEVRNMTENSEFMIHMPFGSMFGDSEDMQKAANTLKAYEAKVLDLYVSATGGDRDAIEAMMKEETLLTADQAKNLGFVTAMIPTMRAVATFNHNKINIMEQKKLESIEKELSGFGKMLKKMSKKLGMSIKMLTVTTGDGTILDFGEAIQEEGQIVVGTTATVDGSPATGDFVLTDGRTLVFESGAITEIKPAEEESVEALKAQVVAKDKEIEELKAAQSTQADSIVEMKKEMKKLNKSFTKFKTNMNTDLGIEDPDNREGRKPKEGESRKLFKE